MPAGRCFKMAGKVMRYLITILAAAGLVVSYLALQVHYSDHTEPCDINAHWDCGIVNRSPYSMIGPIPVAAVGIVGYALIGILALLGRRTLAAVASVIGFAFAVYLSHIEKDVLFVWCLYCVVSQGIILLLSICTVGWVWSARQTPS